MTKSRNTDLLVMATFTLVGLLLYYSGLQAPWYFDDFRNIAENPLVRNPGQALTEIFQPRGVVFFSFSLNHAVSGMEPASFRLTNILLHTGSAILVWKILCRIFHSSTRLPLVGGLLFLAHPVQTQTVTYVVQRMAGMAGFFFLLAIYLYLRGREFGGESGRGGRLWQVGALLAFVLALWSKQNTITLPLVLLALDYYLLDHDRFSFRESLYRILPFLVVALLAVLQLVTGNTEVVGSLSRQVQTFNDQLLNATATPVVASSVPMPLRYFATELVVFWLYLKLFFFPVGQMLDYSWPVVTSLLNWRTLLSLAGFVGLFFLGRGLQLWNRRTTFAVIWIVLTLAVESTLLPLDPVYEHRLYLPLFGAVVILLELFYRWAPERRQLPLLAVILLILAGVTVSRNALWADPVAFWRDNLDKAPASSRVMNNLGQAYLLRGDYGSAVKVLNQALTLNPDDASAAAGIGNSLIHLGRQTEARAAFEQALRLDADNELANSYLGTLSVAAGETERGIQLLQRAVTLKPGNSSYLQNLAVGLEVAGQKTAAEAAYRRGVALFPEKNAFLVGLGGLLDGSGRSSEGLTLLARALNAAPDDARILYHYGLAALHAGNQLEYRRALEGLRDRDPHLHNKLAGQTVR